MHPQPHFESDFLVNIIEGRGRRSPARLSAHLTNRQCLPVDRAAAGSRCCDVSSANYAVVGQPGGCLFGRENALFDSQNSGPFGVPLSPDNLQRLSGNLSAFAIRHQEPSLRKTRIGRAVAGIPICDCARIFRAYTKLSTYSFPTMAASAPVLSLRRTFLSHSRVKSSLNDVATVSISSRDKRRCCAAVSGFPITGTPRSGQYTVLRLRTLFPDHLESQASVYPRGL